MDGADNNILTNIQLSYSQQEFLIDAQVAQSVLVVAAIFISTHKTSETTAITRELALCVMFHKFPRPQHPEPGVNHPRCEGYPCHVRAK